MAQNPYDFFSHSPSWISTSWIKMKKNLKKLVSLCLWLTVFTSRLQIQLICRRVLFSIRGRELGSCRTLKKKPYYFEIAFRIVQRDVKKKIRHISCAHLDQFTSVFKKVSGVMLTVSFSFTEWESEILDLHFLGDASMAYSWQVACLAIVCKSTVWTVYACIKHIKPAGRHWPQTHPIKEEDQRGNRKLQSFRN